MSIDWQIKVRRQILFAAIFTAVFILSGCAEKTQKVYRVGIISGSLSLLEVTGGFKEKMTEVGYVEGDNIIYDWVDLNDNLTKIKEVVNRLLSENVDLIFTYPLNVAQSVKSATSGTGTPIIFAISTIEGTGMIQSLQKPGADITGVRMPSPELAAKRLEILVEMAPKTKRVWLGHRKDYPAVPPALGMLRPLALRLNVTLVVVPVDNGEDLINDLESRAKSGDVDSILLLPDTITLQPENFEGIKKIAKEYRMPFAGLLRYQTGKGALFTYFPDDYTSGALAASQADKILKGIPAGTIPVLTPEAKLLINYKVAQELGLNISEGLLARADEIIR